ncbi:MAG: GNAT family N-acetyltransferase [Bdellovibrionaceae bacterium]|nr:GNAT family N-acetyltransferase [Pseudobdellovibrionaceae bacterium]
MLEIRRATDADASILAELGRKTFVETFADDNTPEDIALYVAETFGTDQQLREIQDPARWIEIAWFAGTAVGFLHLLKGQPDPSVQGPKPLEILRLYVDSRWHGKGVGAALMERSLKIAFDGGFQTLWLGVWERNFRAQAFYRKFGFEIVGQHVFRLGKDEQTDFIMTRELTL